jgi:DNA-damage-inducible protein D
MKKKLNIPENRPLADFLPTITIKAKDLANEITSHNLKNNKNLKGEEVITGEHVKNNENMREMLYKSGIAPENLPPEEDVKKIERRVVSENKKIVKSIKKFKKT